MTDVQPGVLHFGGRVAVVTGAGRGIGRAHALLLAARGASVVVNDLGGSIEGQGSDAGPADEVVAEIVAAGGTAVADGSDVSSHDGGQALIERAVEEFGRIDIVVNNAGIVRWAGMPEVDADNLQAHLAVHVGGSFHTVRAAWPHMAEQGYGRIVMTTSSGVFGLPTNTSYATAKGAVIGLTRSLATAGAKKGIKVNALAPAAMTRMAGPAPGDADVAMAPELVAPMVAYLSARGLPGDRRDLRSGSGPVRADLPGLTPGYVDAAATPEDIAAHWAEINDETGYAVPANLMAWSAGFLAHLSPGAS